ncbi:ferrous iron transport protein A [Enterococcus faecalis]
MLTLAQAQTNKVYIIEAILAEATTKKHLNNLGLVIGGKIVLLQCSGENGIVLLHNSRIALNVAVLNQISIIENKASEVTWLPLDQLKVGETAKIVGIHGQGAVKRRLMDMGLTKGVKIMVRKVAPLADPIELHVRGYELTLRKNEAALILVEKGAK